MGMLGPAQGGAAIADSPHYRVAGSGIGVMSSRDLVPRAGPGEDFANLYSRMRREESEGLRQNADVFGRSLVGYNALRSSANPVEDADHPNRHHHHHHHQSISMPLLSAGPLDRQNECEIQVWTQQAEHQESKEKDPGPGIISSSRAGNCELVAFGGEMDKKLAAEGAFAVQAGSSGTMTNPGAGNMSMTMSMNASHSTIHSTTCQDCGNQAKKDCAHFRCRTCCKTRGFECPTHVKSTWVPAAKRREKQLAEAAALASGQPRIKAKRSRLLSSATTTTSHTSTSAGTTPQRSADINANAGHIMYHQDLNYSSSLPEEVKAQAQFKRVRISSGAGEEVAYYTAIAIGGHVFKGVLTDHGTAETQKQSALPELHLGGRSGVCGSPQDPMIDPSPSTGAAAAASAAAAGTTPSSYCGGVSGSNIMGALT